MGIPRICEIAACVNPSGEMLITIEGEKVAGDW
jgi:hypothetical protein